VRDIFASNDVYDPVPPEFSRAHRSLSDSNAQNGEVRGLNTQNGEVRVICYDCRQGLDNLPSFTVERDSGTITLCADCHEDEQHEVQRLNEGRFKT